MDLFYEYNTSIIDTRRLCRFHLEGRCRFGSRCRFVHKYNENESSRQATENRVTATTAANNSFNNSNLTSTFEAASCSGATQQGEEDERTCGICFDVILSKNEAEKVFGILPNCNHCFCFTCICRWRKSKEFESEVSRACPECRVASDFVYPSRSWMDTKEAKDQFITFRKERMSQRDCKYFKQGKGNCPFGNNCLYRHALANGKKVDVGPPKPRRMNRSIFLNNVHDILFMTDGDTFSDDDLDIDEEYDDTDDYDYEDLYPFNVVYPSDDEDLEAFHDMFDLF